MNKKSKYFWYLIASGVIILFLMMLASSVINIGEKLRQISPIVEYSFYGLAVLLIWFLIVNPVRIILTSPSLSIATTLEKDSIKAHRIYKNVSKNILNNNETSLTDEERNALESFDNYDELRNALHLCMSGSIKKEIRKIIVRNAKAVMLSTAVSQNSKLDMYSVISLNLKMIKEIVEVCGFRPNMRNLSKLTIKVASTALIAEGLESLKIEDVLPTSTINSLSNIPLLKPVLSSVVSGMTNALMTIRIGLVCRGYLFTDSKNVTKNQIRAEAFKDALTLLPQVVAEVVAFFPSKIVKLFTKKKEENNNDLCGNDLATSA
jgi:uncharacterized membrane protein YcjF (UPF0283 family)